MRLDHLLAADPLGAPLTQVQRARAKDVLEACGFALFDGVFVLDEVIPWVTVEDQEGLWRVHVKSPVPEHMLRTFQAACEGLVQEAGLVRIDPLRHREISALEWSQRLVDEGRLAYRKAWP